MRLIALLVLLTNVAMYADDSRWWDVCNPGGGKFGGGHVPEEANDEEVKVLKLLKFKKWKKYEDEFVSFEYPEHVLVKLKVNKAEKPFKVEGGVCSTVDNSYKQAYILSVGKATYGVFLLTPAKRLDDGICFCGPMVHHAYKLNQGTLTRFSMLPGGAVKKAQVIGGGLRFMAFEWTHLACQKSIYERMVASMRLKTREPGGNKTLRKHLIEHYGDDGRLGLITRNTSAAILVKAFGKPVKKIKDGVWSWQWKGEEYPTSLVAKIKDGMVLYYPENGISREWHKPYSGTLPWCEKLVERLPNPKNGDTDDTLSIGEDEDEELEAATPPTSAEKKLFIQTMSKFLQQEAGKSSNKWAEALRIADDAAKLNLTDVSWVKLVLEHGTGTWNETSFIESSAPKQSLPWAIKHLSAQSDALPSTSKLSNDDLESLTNIFDETSAVAWTEMTVLLWAAKESRVRRLVFEHISIQDALTVENRIHEALSKGMAHDQGQLIYYAMQAIPETKIQKKETLVAALQKIPEGRENSQWRETRAKALKYLGTTSKDKPDEKLKN